MKTFIVHFLSPNRIAEKEVLAANEDDAKKKARQLVDIDFPGEHWVDVAANDAVIEKYLRDQEKKEEQTSTARTAPLI
jgi:hypothetical protein